MTSALREAVPASRAAAGRGPGTAPRACIAVVAGLLLFAAFPPVHLWWTAPFGVAALTIAVRGTTWRAAALLGELCGLAFFLPLLQWTNNIAGLAAWVALCAAEAAFLALLAVGVQRVVGLAGWPVWTAALWVLQEAARDRLPFGGFPWGRLAFSQDDSPLLPLVALGGAPLLTFAVALLGGLLAACSVRPSRRAAVAGAAAAVATIAVATAVPVPTGGPTVRVALVQGNVPRSGLDAFAQRSAVLDNHVQATHLLARDVRAGRALRPDLVVWPENASDLDPYTDAEAYAKIDSAVRDVGVPVLVGAVTGSGDGRIRNVGIVWDPRFGPGASYDKQHLVPFGEYMPMRDLLRRISSKVDLVPTDFAPGDRVGLLTLGPTVIGDVICYEIADDTIVRQAVQAGGRMLVVQTNNATYGRTPQPEQQLAMTRLRAVEHGRAVVVAATSGISAVISPDGTVLDRTRVFTQEVLTADIPQRTQRTVATRLGIWPEVALGLLAAAALGRVAAVGLSRRRAA